MRILITAVLSAGALGLAACTTVTTPAAPSSPSASSSSPSPASPSAPSPTSAGPASPPPQPAPTRTSTAPPATVPNVTSPWAVVSAYYGDIESGNYAEAYALIGNGATTGQTYQQFVAGFACTGPQSLTQIGTSGNQVTFRLTATDICTGEVHTYAGTDTVRNGVIVAADVTQIS